MKKIKKILGFYLSFQLILSFALSSSYAEEKEAGKYQPVKQKLKIIPIINLDALATYSKVQGHNAIGGALIDLSISPTIRLNKRNYIIPLYNLNYHRKRQVISQEEGGRLTQETMTHNFFLTYKRLLTRKLTAKFSALGTLAYYKETNDEDWSKGLYDYIDKGALMDFEYTLSHPKERVFKELNFETEYYRRMYTNFRSLISLATPTALEENEKDYDGLKFTLGYLRQNPDGLSFEAEYMPLLKYYTDKLVIDSDGVLISGKEREDNQHTINLDLSYPLTKRLTIGLDNQIIINRSNQNYYDSRNTITLSDDVFTDDYYDYNSYQIKPSLSYNIPIKKNKDLTINLSYSYLNRLYTNRKAQSSNGSYTTEDEEDKYHTINLGLSYPLTDKIKALFIVDYIDAQSNMKYEEYYRYNYDLLTIACGISCRF